MPFNDSNLKRLKENSYAPRKMVLSLLARLEAAENVIAHSARNCDSDCDCDASQAWKAWRQSAGKHA